MFPPEVIERILYHCDGKTLKNARNVNTVCRQIVDYLAKKTGIWKRCCFKDIPENERLQIMNKWVAQEDEDDQSKWLHVYENWLNWHDVHKNIEFEICLKGRHHRIVCIDAMGKYIAVGFENGTAKLFEEDFRYIRVYRHLNIPICSVSIVCDNPIGVPSEMLLYYGDRVYIDDFYQNDTYRPALFRNCYKFSSYKRFICGVTVCGKITIVKITSNDFDKIKSYITVTYVRIYSPETVTCCNLWEGVCTILVDNKVKIIHYYDGAGGSLRSNVMAKEKTRLEFSCEDAYDESKDIRIFNSRIIISLSKCLNSLNRQIFELYILGESNTHSKKMFIPWQTFTANISSMFLHGNTFLIGVNTGMVYFYEIHDWKLFDIGNYSHREDVCKLAPVLSMDAVEFYGRRIFFIATSTRVHQIDGFSVPSLDEELEACSLSE